MRSVYFSWFISLPFHSRPRHAAGERADPLQRHPDADMGRDPDLARPDRRCGFSRRNVPGYHVGQQDIDQGNGENFMSGGHGHVDSSNKKIALLVAVLAALLAISEMGGKSSQTNALSSHIDASNLWTFFQAKTIRQTDAAHRRRGGRGPLQGQPARHAGGDEGPDRAVAADGAALRHRAGDRRRPQGADGPRQGQGGAPRQVAGGLPHVRIRLGRPSSWRSCWPARRR